MQFSDGMQKMQRRPRFQQVKPCAPAVCICRRAKDVGGFPVAGTVYVLASLATAMLLAGRVVALVVLRLSA